MKNARLTGGPSATGVADWADEEAVPKAAPPRESTSNIAAKSTESLARNIATAPSPKSPVGVGMRIVDGSPVVCRRPTQVIHELVGLFVPYTALQSCQAGATRGIHSCQWLHGVEVVVSEAAPATTPLWTLPADADEAKFIGDASLTPGDRYPLLAVEAGQEDTLGTSAEAYHVWYRIALPHRGEVWVQAAIPTAYDTGSDGQPSSVRFDFLADIAASE